MSMDIIAPQAASIVPEQFQSTLIDNLSAALLVDNPSPCLLRAPTGAGKTFILTKVLQNVSKASPTLWFWFVPFVNLIQQTEDSLAANANTVIPISLLRGRNQLPANGQVIISTAQAVAKSKSRAAGYTDGDDDRTRNLDGLVTLARTRGLAIGLIVDEAHIALDEQTEFGKFAQWLRPSRIVMASATPKDARLNQFIQSAGYSSFETFSISRFDVVQARLNKRYIEAVVYDLRESLQTVTDLEQTVLRQAWRRNQRLKQCVTALGIDLVPLMLVQVANGKGTVEAARDQLMRLCKVPATAIGIHSADDPDPVLMASIANDTTKEVLIFKQSAGTGFDAPRAFVLASTKPVNDPDFAAQFIGRVMRVHRSIRAFFPRSIPIDPELDRAYIYLANAAAQQGFEQAVAATASLQSDLEGQTEKLVPRKMKSGAVVYTNAPTDIVELFFDLAYPAGQPGPTSSPPSRLPYGSTPTLDGLEFLSEDADPLDEPEDRISVTPGRTSPRRATTLTTRGLTVTHDRETFRATMLQAGIKFYDKRKNVAKLPEAFRAEQRPEMENMAAASRAAATRLTIDLDLRRNAVLIALNRARDTEVRTELTQGDRSEQKVSLVTDRAALAAEAFRALKSLPQVEDEDAAIIIDVIGRRLREEVESTLEADDGDMPNDAEIRKICRHAAYSVIRKEQDTLAELLYEEISNQAKSVLAGRLPDSMIFAADIPLEGSAKNIYGVMPPSKEQITKLSNTLFLDQRALLEEHIAELTDGSIHYAPYDGAWMLGQDEHQFAKALDRAEFVHWWHRNPDRKGFSVRLVRGEHKNYFYPDFIVCLEHFPGDGPLTRLVETKESVKDAARKAKRASPLYGKVFFMTKDQKKWRWINEDGTLGSPVDLDNLKNMQEWMRRTVPVLSQ